MIESVHNGRRYKIYDFMEMESNVWVKECRSDTLEALIMTRC